MVFGILSVINEIVGEILCYLVNIYWYGDYMGGNVIIGDVGVMIIVYNGVCDCVMVDVICDFFGQEVIILVVLFEVWLVIIFNDEMMLYLNG